MTRKERWLSSVALLAGLLPFIVVASTLQLLPKDVRIVDLVLPIENAAVSKYSYLYVGLFCLVPVLLVIAARILKAKKVVERNFTAMVLAGLVLGVVFLFSGSYGIIHQLIENKVNLLKDFDFYGAAAILLSLLMGMLANFLPDLKQNEILGLKNRYTISSVAVWDKVHTDAADVFTGGYFLLAVLLSGLSIWLDYQYGWLHLVIWGVCSMGLFIWAHAHSKNVAAKMPHPVPELAITDAYTHTENL